MLPLAPIVMTTAPPRPAPQFFDVVVVGSGFGGLAAGVALARERKRSFVILERAAELGGTWRDNTYPGCACDIPSHLYCYSFAPHPDWSRLFSPQAEIKAYLEQVARRFRVLPHVRFNCTFAGARFDAMRACWKIETLEGARYTARALILATGGLSKPLIPKLPGADLFTGKQMHSARWDANYDLRGKRIAVIGTGASAVQIVPEIVPLADKVYVFQRSAPWVLPKPDRPIPPWERRLFRWMPFAQRLVRAGIFRIYERLGEHILGARDVARIEEYARRFIARHIADPELRAKVTPDYRLGCKRVLFSNDWYRALNASNVELIASPVAQLDASAVITPGGLRREVDCVIYATGFDVHGTPRVRIVGLDGVALDEVWRERREAYMGCTVAGFPNLFFVIGPNSGTGHNSLVYIMECQVRYILQLLRAADRKRAAWVQPRLAAQRAYNERLEKKLAATAWTQGRCRSWYQDPSGRVTTLWPGLLTEYRRLTRRIDEAAFEWGFTPAPITTAVPTARASSE